MKRMGIRGLPGAGRERGRGLSGGGRGMGRGLPGGGGKVRGLQREGGKGRMERWIA